MFSGCILLRNIVSVPTKTFHPKKKNRFPRLAVSVTVVSGIVSVATDCVSEEKASSIRLSDRDLTSA